MLLETSNIPLKPCPFCGAAAKLWVEFIPYYNSPFDYDERNKYHCGCMECDIRFSAYWDKDGVVERWNSRGKDT